MASWCSCRCPSISTKIPVLDMLDPAKDVDALTPTNAGLLLAGRAHLVSCTPAGVMLLLKEYVGDIAGKEALVIGRSLLFGKPAAQLLLAANATVTMAHSRSRDLPALARRADILVAAIGKPEFVKADWIKPGATVIDVGINRVDARRRQNQAGRRCRLRGGEGSRRRHHAGARRRRRHDDRLPDAQHADRGLRARTALPDAAARASRALLGRFAQIRSSPGSSAGEISSS